MRFIKFSPRSKAHPGFTLIELSIVLVVIGLIVGGVVVGQTLITAAQVRAEITQIEKFNQASNTFKGKYNYLPGDIIASAASQFGFAARGLYAGEGDGNGLIEGNDCNGGSPGTCNSGIIEGAGETSMFWVDLSAAKLIDNSFNTANATTLPTNNVPLTGVSSYLPIAKMGSNLFVSVYSSNGVNFFAISQVTGIYNSSLYGTLSNTVGIPVKQAYAVDAKMDDGLPLSGNITTAFMTTGPLSSPVSATAGGTYASCSDSVTGTYSITVNNGSGANCALSIKFQ